MKQRIAIILAVILTLSVFTLSRAQDGQPSPTPSSDSGMAGMDMGDAHATPTADMSGMNMGGGNRYR